ncbi:histidine kinase [Novosphingobium kunmingense]|uniref:Histidine kinase n=2 Tax=Novosphingobium kunmingense TaxID=1211806 RepID=A0A2N0H4X7_9SPHN|nr:histidine kinase [Novosphingobium kunmingense]PKB13989.1 histidine kinase [Novosphingobium kunmingense]
MEDSTALPRVPARVVIASAVGLWLAYFAIATLRGWLVGLELYDALLWRRAFVILASMGVTLGLWPLLRLLDPRPLWEKSLAVLLVALPASLALALINQWTFASIEEQATAQIGARDGLRIRSDEAGNLLVDPLDREEEAASEPAPSAPPVIEQPSPTVPTIAQQEQKDQEPVITIDARTRDDIRWRQLVDVALGRYFLLLAWAALYYALVNAEQARAAERREGEYRRAAKAAELRSLRYQVNPHFLFNTLNSLSALVMTGKGDAAERMIQSLSSFYRRSLAGDPTADHSLEQELAQQRLYLEIEGVRFPDRLRVAIAMPDDLADASVPGMILQPLVENAVRYGVSAVTRPVTVSIAARSEGDALILEVGDDGLGASGEAAKGFGIGLANVRDRLAARYGEAADLSAGPRPDGGWSTQLRLPLERHG